MLESWVGVEWMQGVKTYAIFSFFENNFFVSRSFLNKYFYWIYRASGVSKYFSKFSSRLKEKKKYQKLSSLHIPCRKNEFLRINLSNATVEARFSLQDFMMGFIKRCHKTIKIKAIQWNETWAWCFCLKTVGRAPCCAYDILLYENMMRVVGKRERRQEKATASFLRLLSICCVQNLGPAQLVVPFKVMSFKNFNYLEKFSFIIVERQSFVSIKQTNVYEIEL